MNRKAKSYREALRYASRFTNCTFVLSFDPGITDSIVSASLVRDLKLLLKLRINLVLYCREGSKPYATWVNPKFPRYRRGDRDYQGIGSLYRHISIYR